MDSKIIVTADNSKTLLIEELNETYHSTKGAITESKHVFIKEGLDFAGLENVKILEMGFGTGLNAILTFDYSATHNYKIDYETIEAFPLKFEQINEMNYLQDLDLIKYKDVFEKMHLIDDQCNILLNDNFSFQKRINKIENITLPKSAYDLVFYDAFGPKAQPNLWSVEILQKFYDALKVDGILVTYCAQGQFKRNLKEIGFEVHSIPGPPGKREMTRAIKQP